MEDLMIKSWKKLEGEKSTAIKTKDQESQSSTSNRWSTFPVDLLKKIDCQKENQNFDDLRNNSIHGLDQVNQSCGQNTRKCVNDSKHSNSLLATILNGKRMTKPTKNRAPCKKETKNMPIKNTTRKVLAEKQIRPPRTCIKPAIILRSSRRRGANLLDINLSNSSSVVSHERKLEMTEYENQTKDDKILIKKEESPTADSTKNLDILPKKRYHRRKCSEPMKNEGIQTRQSRSMMLMQNKTDCEQFSDVPKTVKCGDFKSDEQSEVKEEDKGCDILCTPDINVNDHMEVKFLIDDHNRADGLIKKEDNEDLGNDNDQLAVNFTTKINEPSSTSTASTEPKLISIDTNYPKIETKYSPPFKKQEQENADGNLIQKLRHVNAQAMPVYTSKIAVPKNDPSNTSGEIESLHLSGMSETDRDKTEMKEEFSELAKEEAQTRLDNVSLCSKTDKSTEPKTVNLSNTDSEETLSNVESVPNSPPQETWPKFTGRNLKFSDKVLRNKISASVNLSTIQQISNTEIPKSVGKHRRSETVINSTLKRGTKRDESKLRYYTETSENDNPLRINASEENSNNDDLGKTKKTSWLRHYERPQKTHAVSAKNAYARSDNSEQKNSLQKNHHSYHQQRKYAETTKKTSGTSTCGNFTAAEELKSRKNCSKKFQSPINNNPPCRKRGRPRKLDNEDSEINPKKRSKSPANANNRRSEPSVTEATLNGSCLTKLESDILFFKFSQHGNFKYSSEQPPIIIYDNELYRKINARMQCYDPRKYYTHPHNPKTESNSASGTNPQQQQNFPCHDNCNRLDTLQNSRSGEFAHKVRTINPNSHTFSRESIDDNKYSRSFSSPCSMQTNIPSSGNGFDGAPNYTQTGYDTAANYHQNFYNNNLNQSYFNNYSGIESSTNFMNNMNSGTRLTNLSTNINNSDNNLNFTINPNQYQNSIPCGEMDLTMNNGNNMSSNSTDFMQKSAVNNLNPGWNSSSVNQPLDSVNGLPIDLDSMNRGNVSNQSMNSSSDQNNLMNNSNTALNSETSWMNRTDNMMNPRFPVMLPWHRSLPMYNAYLNNENSYYNNTFNPYAASMEFDLSNYPHANINGKNGMGVNNTNTWSQNSLSSFDGQSNSLNTTSSAFSNYNSGSSQVNSNVNQGINLSLSSNNVINTTVSQTNRLEEVGATNLGIGLGNGLNSNDKQAEGSDNFQQIETTDNVSKEKSVETYGEELCLPYSMGYQNDADNLDFDDVDMGNGNYDNLEKQAEQILPEIRDYITQKLDSFDDCFNQNYKQTDLPNSNNLPDPLNNRETEMTKLRKELVEFTKQYSDDQTSSSSQISQGDELFS